MRVALFFDGNNFYRTMEAAVGSLELNYDNLAQWVVSKVSKDKSDFVGAYYYTGVEENSSLNRFLSGLELRPGFFVRRETVVQRSFHCPSCKNEIIQTQEKRVDTRMVAEMVRLAALNSYDCAVVFSGDADLVPAIEVVSLLGKRVYIASWGGMAVANDLRTQSFGMFDLIEGLDMFSTGRSRQTDSLLRCQGFTMEDVLAQVVQAWEYFSSRDGHISRWYFENRWKASGPCPPPGEPRQESLDLLIQHGKVEIFEAQMNGRIILALRPR